MIVSNRFREVCVAASVCIFSATVVFSEEANTLPYGLYSGGDIFSHSISPEESPNMRREQRNQNKRTQNSEDIIDDALSSFGVNTSGLIRLGRVGSGAGLVYRRTSPYNGSQTRCSLSSDALNCRWSLRF